MSAVMKDTGPQLACDVSGVGIRVTLASQNEVASVTPTPTF